MSLNVSMSSPHCKHGSNIQTDHSYRLHNLPMAGNYRYPIGSAALAFKRAVLSLANLWSHSKVKVFIFLMCLTTAFLIVATCQFMWDKNGLSFTISSTLFRPVVIPTSTAAVDVSCKKDLVCMKLLVRLISSKLEYAPRNTPDVKDVIAADPDLFSVIPRHFLPGIKSPCWYQEVSSEISTDPYRGNRFRKYSTGLVALYDRLRDKFQQHLQHKDNKVFRLRCLPFFYIIGQPKCGTTDLYQRLHQHPDIKFNTMKEPHWWTRKRFGFVRFTDGFQEIFPLEDYLDLFDLVATKIQEKLSGESSGDTTQFVTGEASVSIMWDNHARGYLHIGREETEPRFLNLDYIHAAQPDAKIIIILRDPVERLYSDYLFLTMNHKSTEDFHAKVVKSLHLFQSCLSERSLRSCAYNTSLFSTMPVRLSLGMYVVFLLDWLTVFRRDQILILRLEDYSANLKVAMKKVFDFLSLGPISEQLEATIANQPRSNIRHMVDTKLGDMLPATRDLLREFYLPLNQKLASVLDNKAFQWSSN